MVNLRPTFSSIQNLASVLSVLIGIKVKVFTKTKKDYNNIFSTTFIIHNGPMYKAFDSFGFHLFSSGYFMYTNVKCFASFLSPHPVYNIKGVPGTRTANQWGIIPAKRSLACDVIQVSISLTSEVEVRFCAKIAFFPF